ncbi:MAG TPA: radical SAM family heme chaperone HemW [Geminicoccaceae bacterium]|nr:radical SAM family heme chaperone HemW [Geminicoccaceae bacterium]
MTFAAMAQARSSDGAARAEPGFGLYVHWPFCRAKCPYCDFNSHVAPQVDEARFARALVGEIDRHADELGPRRLASIFFGGGTPSLMAPATVAAVIERAVARFAPADDLEITLEANPTSVEAERLAGFRAAGVNRVSLGVQALDDAALRFLGREHDAAEALAAVDLAASLFERFSFDLIYGRPGQSAASWRAELDCALGHMGGHLSVYQLTIEPGTRFALLERSGALRMPDDDLQADLYEVTRERLEGAGLAAYEVSNHARPGEECRHNLVYWRSGEWLGVGPGAHGRLNVGGARVATEAWRLPKAWLERVEGAGSGERTRVPVDRAEQVEEFLVMGLRLAEGIELQRLVRQGGRAVEELIDPAALERFIDDGWLTRREGRLAATAAGRQRLNAILAALLVPPGAAADRDRAEACARERGRGRAALIVAEPADLAAGRSSGPLARRAAGSRPGGTDHRGCCGR